MEGDGRPLTQEERDALRIHTAIDKIGEDVKKYLLDSTQFVLSKSEEFISKYGKNPEYEDFLTESNLTALIISSINNGIGDLGILCESHDVRDPIRVSKAANVIGRRLDSRLLPPHSPTKMPLAERREFYLKSPVKPPDPGPLSRKRGRVSSDGLTLLPGPNKGGGNRTRRRRRRH
jgi:hypothetical protein